MISCEEDGLLNQSMNVNEEPFEVKKAIRLNVANETREDKKVVVKWQMRDNFGNIIESCEEETEVKKLSSLWFERKELPGLSLYENYVSYQLEDRGSIVSSGSVLFCPPKHFRFVDPELKVRCENDEIIVSSRYFAKNIEIRNENDDLILSDNYFDLNGGEKRVRILCGKPEKIRVRSVFDIR